MPLSATSHKTRGFTLLEILVSLSIVGLVVGLTVPQLLGLHRTNRTNSDTLSLNTVAVNHMEAIKKSWNTLNRTVSPPVADNWNAGTYTTGTNQVRFSCATWTSLNPSTPPTNFTATCATTGTSSQLKRIRLEVSNNSGATLITYMDVARPS